MPTLTLAAKDLRLLLRDTRAVVILLLMPLVFILVLGLTLGEGFGQKPDDRLRVTFVNLDEGLPANPGPFPDRPWSEVVIDDLGTTADIKLEKVDLDTAERLVRRGQRSAVLVFRADFSQLVHRCSFMNTTKDNVTPINPFYRDGVNLKEIGLDLLRDPTQSAAASIIEQVGQVTMLRVVMPWMIGRAFDKLSEREFIDRLGPLVKVPVLGREVSLETLIRTDAQKIAVGNGVQGALKELFKKYNLQAKTWAELTKEKPKPPGEGRSVTAFDDSTEGQGFFNRGAARYQILVPSYTVMFAFFLVLTTGWLFVAERRQGTLMRLRLAPLTRGQILLGKMLPCLLLSLVQGAFLLIAGRLVFGMSWGAQPLWLIPVVAATSLAAMGLALLVASIARTETQVAVYGTLLVLVLAGLSGCLMPRELMPESVRQITLVTPHAWALDAYKQVLTNPQPEAAVIVPAIAALGGFAALFVGLAWWRLRLD